MTLTLDLDPTTASRPRRDGPGALLVWRLEMGKLGRQLRVRIATAVCLVSPFLLLAAVKAQGAVPSDTLFGQWLHQSGYALPMVVLAFAGQWLLPLLTSVVAGDIFSAEDHHGTWKTVLTRSRSRNQIFAGKTFAAVTYTLGELGLLAVSSLAAGALLGARPVVGLTGQLVAPGRAVPMVLASWGTQAAPQLAFCAMAVTFSVASRSSPAGIGGPLVVGLLVQMASFITLPSGLRSALPGTAFGSWHGIWTEPTFYGPLASGTAVSLAWFGAFVLVSWLLFRRRAVAAW